METRSPFEIDEAFLQLKVNVEIPALSHASGIAVTTLAVWKG